MGIPYITTGMRILRIANYWYWCKTYCYLYIYIYNYREPLEKSFEIPIDKWSNIE